MVESSKRSAATRHTAALIGKTGVGKTTIYNALCNTSHATTYNKGSLTIHIRKNDVSHGNRSFELIDMPGNDSNEMPV